ncbi:TonB-dependent receptor [uncultured Muriicola sp.]|uniref:TonB-dependent receptor n=1 Tax=uncultured Muriicola sp. TaxID=1583102 RepID=UPI00262AEAE6|nr:TonB-dependent receptor [uncultured Muriicola sp.]
MKKQLPLLLLIYGFISHAQNSLEGSVVNSDTQEPLEQVSIYFPQLEKGTVTDAEGRYTLNDLPQGKYKIVASYIGFLTYSSSITIQSDTNSLNIALTPSAIEMEEVIVSTPFHKLQRENVMKVEQEKMATLRTNGAITLADGIRNIAGVESVSTGIGIGKPVIRGLSANRVLVYSQGIRLENQQFGDEHGLGISDAGIESIEVIKGPASLLYGSDALGGVLYLNPEKYALGGTSTSDINLNYFSNTEGIATNLGYKTSGKKLKFLVRAGITSHADYLAGNDQRVTNSRFKEYDLKSGIAYQSGNFKTDLRYNYNKSDLGIPEDIGAQTKDRTPDTPFQELQSHILSSSTNLFFKESSLKLVLGYIFNGRKEFEEGEPDLPALDMNLSTFNFNLQYHLPKGKILETIIGVQGMDQTNKNFGEEVLIPDADTRDIGVLSTSHIHLGKSDVQIGLRYDHRKIIGEENGTFGEEGYIAAIDRNFNSVNAALGIRSDLGKNLIGRLNVASGFRAPNLAELTSNGIHEGTNRFEIGDPDLNNEKNIQLDLSIEYSNEHVEVFINGFHNTVNDFIYVEPNGDFVDLDPVYIYRQQDATLYGGEIGFHLHPHPLDWLHIESTFESVTGMLKNDEDLPLIPANKITNTLRIEDTTPSTSWFQKGYGYLTLLSVMDQNRVSDFETPTSGYTLLNIGFGGAIEVFGNEMQLRVSVNNLLDKTYISHLSRLKIDGIPNIGRNISIGVHYPI